MSSAEPSAAPSVVDSSDDQAPAPAPDNGRSPDGDVKEIGWIRAILSGLAILLVGFGAIVASNAIVTRALRLRRTPREWLATAVFLVVVIGMAWVLRCLQARKLI
jgi:xanthine/uracil permease